MIGRRRCELAGVFGAWVANPSSRSPDPTDARRSHASSGRRRERRLELELTVPDAPQALLDHLCAGSGDHRLLGVAFTDEERERLRAGEVVVLAMRCDRCVWERRVLFRL